MAGMRWRAWAVIVVLIGAFGVWPVLAQRDSYPVSNLAMFASPRSRTEPVVTAVAVAGDGAAPRVWRLGPQRLAGTDEVIAAGAAVRRAVAAGTAEVLCHDIAARVATRGPKEAEAVEVVTERYDAVAWFQGRRVPIERIVHHRCGVPEREP